MGDIATTIRVAYWRKELAHALDEIERLRGLVIAWVEAEVTDGFHDEPECDCGAPLCVASTALRKAVGR